MSKTLSQEKFKLDNFQLESIEHIKNGFSVITCAPTGAGKTVIAKEAIRMAIESGKKVFYTAPLKALINQKYYEFSEAFGEERVGILTGDTNKNRDANIIVMTTEIYRNMLYGTSFGSIDPFLHDLQYIIFDEFHFINDANRGTVWEESVIYTPKSVQIIALSATINNPEELKEWIETIHGKCKLVETFDRPVPLIHYYFKDEFLSPLLTTNGKLNPQLKERNDNRFGKNKGKFGNRFSSGGNAAKAEIKTVIEELHKRDMLPAIYFVFSRKGCDRAVEDCRSLDLLTKADHKELNQEIDKAMAHTPIIEKFNQLEMLRKGFAAHHAGLLPQVKSLIEELFTKGLIKVVFSTETLAAGINMPARATVISSISKATDDGFRTLKTSEFMQMSGRAGRRGMDEAGYVVTIKSGNYGAAEVAYLASSKPEDITSHFTASYEMVLNLLQGHEYAEIKNLIAKSFGQYLVNNRLKDEEAELKKLEDQIMDLQHPLCPGEVGDLNHYTELQAKLDTIRRERKALEKQMECVDEIEGSIEILTMEAKNYPCNGCPNQKPCSKQMDKIKRYKKQSKELEYKIEDIKNMCWEEFEKVVDLLKAEGYVDSKYKPTAKGKTCAALRADNTYFLTELLLSPMFNNVRATEFAALMSCFVIGEGRAREKSYSNLAKVVQEKERDFKNVARNVIQTQRKFGLNAAIEMNLNLSNIVLDWASGQTWEEINQGIMLDEGDILRGIRRTVDISKQISKTPNIDVKVQNLAAEAAKLMERDLVLENL